MAPVWRRPWFIGMVIVLLGAFGLQSGRVILRDRRLREAQRRLMEDMDRELQAARDMQMGLLPKASLQIEGVDLAGICRPANHVGGDYYTYLPLGEDGNRIAIVLADVSGHAMEAATVAMRFNEILRYEVKGRTSAVDILKGLDASLRGQIPPEMFVTCGIGLLDIPKGILTFASAANPEVCHYSRAEDAVRPLCVTGYPLGLPLILQAESPFNSLDLQLGSGDVVVLASDGVEEAQDGREDFYGPERLASAIRSAAGRSASAESICSAVVDDVTRFTGEAPQIDDITVVVLRIH